MRRADSKNARIGSMRSADSGRGSVSIHWPDGLTSATVVIGTPSDVRRPSVTALSVCSGPPDLPTESENRSGLIP